MMRIIVTFILSFLSFAASAQTTQILGAPNTRIATKGDMSVDSIFYLPRTLVTSRTPTQAGALRYQSSDSALYQWTGTAWRKAGGGDVDTLLLSTRAWRQKGIDSVASVRIGGSGVTGYIPKFTAARTLDSSQIFQQGGNIGIGTATPDTFRLNVNGAVRTGTLSVNTNGQAANINTFQRSGTTGLNIFIGGAGGTLTGTTGIQSSQNVTLGISAGTSITTGNNLVAIGAFALQNATTSTDAVGVGVSALQNNTANNVIGIGTNALGANTTGTNNIAIGVSALTTNQTGNANVAMGRSALQVSTTSNNTAIGHNASNALTSGANATAVGANALLFITTASNNTALGYDAGRLTNAGNALQTAANSTFIGNDTRASADGNTNEIVIGHSGRGLGSNSVVLGNSSITNTYLRGKTLVNTVTDAGFQFDVNGTARTGTLTINTNGQGRTIRTDQASGTNGNNIFIGGAGGTLTGTTGNQSSANTFVGVSSGTSLTTAAGNSGFGNQSLSAVTSGNSNSAFGAEALRNNTTGFSNCAFGTNALQSLTTGARNSAFGLSALRYVVLYTNNSAFGHGAGELTNAGAVADSIESGLYLGWDTRSATNKTSNEIVIGPAGRGNGSNTVTIGNSSITQNYFTGEMLVGYTSDQGAFSLQANGNALINGNIRTAAPAGGTANDWRLGTVATVTPTSPNRTIEVSIGGTIYYIHAKTTND